MEKLFLLLTTHKFTDLSEADTRSHFQAKAQQLSKETPDLHSDRNITGQMVFTSLTPAFIMDFNFNEGT